MTTVRLILCVLVLFAHVQTVQAASCPGGAAYYAPGNRSAKDSNEGTALSPVRTLARAKEILSPNGGRVYLIDKGRVVFIRCVAVDYGDDIPTG